MARRPRRNHSAAFKAKVALVVVRGEKTAAESTHQFDMRPNQITQWRAQLLESASGAFGMTSEAAPPPIDDELMKVTSTCRQGRNRRISKKCKHEQSTCERHIAAQKN